MVRIFAVLLGLALMAACQRQSPPQPPRPCVFEVPAAFSGWAMIECSVPNVPGVEGSDGRNVFKLDANGRVVTSTQIGKNWGDWSFVAVGPDRRRLQEGVEGKGGEIWGISFNQVHQVGARGDDHQFRESIVFFVGSEASYHAAKDKKPRLK